MAKGTIPKLEKPFANRIVGHGEEAVDELLANPFNWRLHSEAQQHALAGAIDDVGFIRSVTVNRLSGAVVDGHLRVTLALRSGVKTLPVEYVELSEDEERKALLTLDPIAAMAASDKAKLDELLRSVQSDDARVTQLLNDLAQREGLQYGAELLEDPGPQIDRAQELQEIWKVQPGDIWECADQKIICGDCTDRVVVRKVMGSEKADFIFTDPPYGHSNNDGDLIQNWESALGRPKKASSAPRPITNDKPEEAARVFTAFLEIARDLLRSGGCCCCCCCCGGGGPDPQFARWALEMDRAIGFKHMVIWDKGGLGMGWHYRRCYETILVAEKKGGKCHWFGGNDVPNVIRDIGKIIPSANQHPTEKPVELAEWFIQLHSQPAEVVFDPFLGSGTTLVACHRLGRWGRGVEILPAYVSVCLQRLSDLGLSPRRVES